MELLKQDSSNYLYHLPGDILNYLEPFVIIAILEFQCEEYDHKINKIKNTITDKNTLLIKKKKKKSMLENNDGINNDIERQIENLRTDIDSIKFTIEYQQSQMLLWNNLKRKIIKFQRTIGFMYAYLPVNHKLIKIEELSQYSENNIRAIFLYIHLGRVNLKGLNDSVTIIELNKCFRDVKFEDTINWIKSNYCFSCQCIDHKNGTCLKSNLFFDFRFELDSI